MMSRNSQNAVPAGTACTSTRRRTPIAIWAPLFAVILLMAVSLNQQGDDSRSPDRATASPEDPQPAFTPALAPKPGQAKETRMLPIPHAAETALISYGSSDGEVGMHFLPEVEARGPQSFIVGPSGRVHVADTANQRICTFDTTGQFIASLPLGGICVSDLMLHAPGSFVVFDSATSSLSALDADGNLLSSLSMPLGGELSLGYFHTLDGSIFIADGALTDVLVATIKDGVLRAADPRVRIHGIHGSSGRLYCLNLVPNELLSVTVTETDGAKREVAARICADGIASARFVGETREGLICIQVERVGDGSVLLEALLLGRNGEEVAVIQLPTVHYCIWTARLIDVTPSGSVVQFAPGSDSALLRMFMFSVD